MSAPFNVTFFRDHAARDSRVDLLTPEALAKLITEMAAAEKSRLPWLKLATFGVNRSGKNSLRHDGNVDAITGVEGDYDGERISFDEAVAIAKRAGLAAIIYTSPSHTPDAPRWRVLCPTREPLPPAVRTTLMARLNGLYGGVFGGESFSLSQSYYYGRDASNEAADHRVEVAEGTCIDLLDELDEIAIYKTNGHANGHAEDYEPKAADDLRASDIADVFAALAVIPNESEAEWDGWKAIALAVHAAAGGGATGFLAFDYWSKKNRAYDPAKTRECWAEVSQRPGNRSGMGKLVYLAREAVPGWRKPSDVAKDWTIPPRGGERAQTDEGEEDWESYASGSDWPEPDVSLVSDDRPDAPMLSDDALPAGWSDWVRAEAAARACPADYVAAALITTASALIGNARHVRATPTWTEPPHLWGALVGGPSTGKTPAMRPLIDVVREVERKAEPAWDAACGLHALLAATAKAATEVWHADVKKAVKDGATPPPRPPAAEEPAAPPRPRTMAMDTTTEELQHMLAGQPRGLLYVRDELSGWLGNHDRYGGNGGDRAFYLECWNASTYVVDRVKHQGKPVRIDRAALGILGGLQPDKLREALSGADDGLAARFFYIWPDPVPIEKLTAGSLGDASARLSSVGWYLSYLSMESAAPKAVPIDPDALALFEGLRKRAMEAARASRGLAAGWHGKTPGRALRLALVFEFLAAAMGYATAGTKAEPQAVSADAMAKAAAYLDYLAAMFERVTAGLAVSGPEADAATIARELLRTRQTTLNERELYRRQGWAWLRDNERRAAAMKVLSTAGWVRPEQACSIGRPRGGWRVNPRLGQN